MTSNEGEPGGLEFLHHCSYPHTLDRRNRQTSTGCHSGVQIVYITLQTLHNVSPYTQVHWGTGWRSWMGNSAVGSIPDGVIEISRDFDPSIRAMTCV